MVFLSGVEGGCRNDLGVDFLEFPAGQQGFATGFGDLAFFSVLPVNTAAVLAAAIAELFVLHSRVDVFPEIVDQLGIAQLAGVVADAH